MKEAVNNFMLEGAPIVPNCTFIAKFGSRAKKPLTDLELKITLEGSQPQTIHFLLDVECQGEYNVSVTQKN